MRASRSLLVILMVLAHPLVAAARDWPSWNGPNHDLTARGSGVFEGPTFGLERLWVKPLGSGYPSVVGVGDRLIAAFSDGTWDVMVALDTRSGEELWRYRIGETYEGHDTSDDGPVATPTVRDGLVYGLSPRGRLFALDLEGGREVWSRQLVEELGAREPFWGFNSSPTVIGGVLVMQTGGSGGHSVSALDPATGELQWSVGDEVVDYQSPVPLHVGDRELILALTNDSILGLLPETGQVLWKQHHGFEEGESVGYMQPVPLGEDRFLLVSWTGSAAFQVTEVDDAHRVAELWRTRALALRGPFSLAAPFDGHIYGFSRSFLSCLDAGTGEVVWRSRQPGPGSLVLVDAHLVILTREGELVVAEASPEGYREKSRVKALESAYTGRPSFVAGRFYVRNLEQIASLGVTERAWAEAAPAGLPESELLGVVGRLVREVRASDEGPRVVDAFMAAHPEMPILEGDDIVHFVYRGDVPDVALNGSMLPYDEQLILHHLDGTDLHFRSVKLKPGGLFTYSYEIAYELRGDPLNPRKPDIEDDTLSAFTTGGYEEPAHLREPQGERGRIVKLDWKSEILGNERPVRVYLPPGYEETQERYPLLVVQRGPMALDMGRMDHSLDNLVGRSVAPLVAAFVPRLSSAEFGAAAADYSRALAEELVPLLDRTYRTVARPESRAVMGTVTGGTMALHTALQHPGLFGRVAAQSALFGDLEDAIVALIGNSAQPGLQVHVQWSAYDLRFQNRDAGADSRRILELLRSRGHQPTTGEPPHGVGGWGESGARILWNAWRQSTDQILQALFPLE